jgi:large subunit ribosomal protein L21
MYAIIENGSKQYKVTPGELVKLEKLEGEKGKEIVFKALWSSKGEGGGAQGGTVKAEIVRHLRGPKVIVFKKRTKKAYQKTQGHRQDLTEVKVKEIGA